jgi:hypothetical protein
MDIQEILKAEFNQHIVFRERRPGIFQVIAPLYHEDGDMVDIYLDLPKHDGGVVRISDHGKTLMRLSYSYEIDTATKRRILGRILSENGISEDRGRFQLETTPEHLYPSLLQFAQTVAKVSNMQMFKREVVQNLFYETLNDFVVSQLSPYRPQPHYIPIPDRDDLDVDWRFPLQSRDIYLYGVRDTPKARLVGLECLEYQKLNIPFRSVIIHEDLENGLSKKDQRRITNIADKQFATLADFVSDAERYFARETETARQHPVM